MFEFTDRVPASGKANRKKITHSDGSVEYVTIENADDANPVGTPLNKATFEAMQTAIMPVVGTYTGNGEAERFIDLGFTPAAVLVLLGGRTTQEHLYGIMKGGLATTTEPAKNHNVAGISISENGFTVIMYDQGGSWDEYDINCNVSGVSYTFIAFKGIDRGVIN